MFMHSSTHTHTYLGPCKSNETARLRRTVYRQTWRQGCLKNHAQSTVSRVYSLLRCGYQKSPQIFYCTGTKSRLIYWFKVRQLVAAMVLFRFQFQINADVSEYFQYYFGATVNDFNIQFYKRSTLSSDVILQVETPFQCKLNVRDVGCKSNEKRQRIGVDRATRQWACSYGS